MTARIQTEQELWEKIAALGLSEDDPQLPGIVCSLIGHSRIQTYGFWYYYCARCGTQLGDTLAGVYSGAEKAVIVGHDCDICRANYEELTWRDKFMVDDPFKKEKSTAATVDK